MSYNQPPNYGTPPPPGGGGYGGQPYGGQPGPGSSGDPGTLDLPYYGIGFGGAVKRAFQKYARFDGRASRSEFWWFTLAYMLLVLVLYIPLIIGSAAESAALVIVFGLLLFAAFLAVIVPSIALSVRRLHDVNLSGWLYLIGLIPCASIVLIVFYCLPSKPEGARFDRPGAGGGPAGPGYGYNPQGPGPYGR